MITEKLIAELGIEKGDNVVAQLANRAVIYGKYMGMTGAYATVITALGREKVPTHDGRIRKPVGDREMTLCGRAGSGGINWKREKQKVVARQAFVDVAQEDEERAQRKPMAERMKEFIALYSENPDMPRKEMARRLGLTSEYIQCLITRARRQGLIARREKREETDTAEEKPLNIVNKPKGNVVGSIVNPDVDCLEKLCAFVRAGGYSLQFGTNCLEVVKE